MAEQSTHAPAAAPAAVLAAASAQTAKAAKITATLVGRRVLKAAATKTACATFEHCIAPAWALAVSAAKALSILFRYIEIASKSRPDSAAAVVSVA
ncbi:MAG: hypothetical protein EWM45_06425 [Rhodopseudomonas palustris]|uniref:hypothetical protein n=1 Tax=Rhodopseudomonas faecalis TaxID=99655 RepID=UPI0011B6FE0A|nr:hypothetical protein [Rhodopseudomonas faecalis]TAH67822.1 MAG: hypothetical protein EWM45_06425 [Rhodopseudomonas palustris]